MKTVLMGEILRQRTARLRPAVELAATGRASHSGPPLNAIRVIRDQSTTGEHGRKTRDSSARYETIAKSYTGLTPAEQANTIVVTG